MTEQVLRDTYYERIKKLNITHYGGEVSYYSVAALRPAEKEFLSRLPQGASILDVGCGSGRFSINAARLGFQVTGVDITPAAIESCKKRATEEDLQNAHFGVLDITASLPAEQFDYVFCPRFVINAISTDEHRRQAIENMYAACKPGGTIFMESFNIMYLGKGPIVPVLNIVKSAYRHVRVWLANRGLVGYDGLFPGDITYPANKAEGATDGYAHLPTIFEVKKYLKHGKTYSIYEVIKQKKKDYLKPFRYSIWTVEENVGM